MSGSGAAGHHGAIQGAKLGKKVAIVEGNPVLDGASINTGTIPSKTLREAVLRLGKRGVDLFEGSIDYFLNRVRFSGPASTWYPAEGRVG